MKLKIIIIYLTLLMFFVFSEDQKKITLELNEETACNLAIAKNLGLEREKLKFLADKWSLIASWNVFIPSVTMSANLSRSNLNEDDRTFRGEVTYVPNSQIPTTHFHIPFSQTTSQWSVSANFNLSLGLNAAQGFKIYQTILDFKSGKIDLETAKKQLLTNTKKDLYQLILIQKQIDIFKQSIVSAEKRYNQAVLNYKNGYIPEYQMLSSQVSLENLKPELARLEFGYQARLLAFKQLLGIKKEVELKFTASIERKKETFNVEELIVKYLKNNLSLKAMNIGIKMRENARNFAIASFTPTFTMLYTMDPSFNQDPFKEKWFNDINHEWKQRAGMFNLGLSMPIGVFTPFSKEMMDIVGTQIAIKELKLNYEEVKQNLEVNVEILIGQLEKSKKSIDSLKLNIELAKKAFLKTEEAYNAGSKDLLEVEEAQKSYNNAEYNMLSEEYNYTTGLLDLEFLLDTSLENK